MKTGFSTLLIYWLLSVSVNIRAFETDFWPGEGVPHFSARAEQLILHQQPSSTSSKLAPYSTTPTVEIPYAESRLLTISPGLVEAKIASTLYGRNFGPIKWLTEQRYYESSDQWIVLAIQIGEQIEHLQDRAEGACIARIKSEVYELEQCPWLGADEATGFTVSGPPVTQWWIQVLNPSGQAVGWLLVDEKQIKLLTRSF